MKENYRDIVKKALSMANESFVGRDNDSFQGKIHPDILNAVKNRKTSIGDHPALPSGGARSFDYALISDRYEEILKTCKSAFDSDVIDESDDNISKSMTQLLIDTINAEAPNRSKLEELAKTLLLDEYGLSEDSVIIECRLVDKVSNGDSLKREFSDESHIMEFERYSDIENGEGEIMKRRLINAMIQGCANRHNHMYHMVNKELDEISPTLINKYKKLTSLNDLSYFKKIKPSSSLTAGSVSVSYDDDGRGVIKAEAMIFPILIHELVKGFMELIASNGFTKDEKLNEFITSQADFTAAEPWDLRIGPGLWAKFMDAIPEDKVRLKSHVFYEVVKMPVKKFNSTMKEIFAGTREGKRIVEDIIKRYETMMEREKLQELKDTRRSDDENRTMSEIDRIIDSGLSELFK